MLPKRPRLIKAMLLAVGLLIGAVAAEGFLRWAAPYRFFYQFARFVGPGADPAVNEVVDPLLGPGLTLTHDGRCFGLRPNFRARMKSSEFDVEFSTNEMGLRNGAIGPKTGPRVLGLGDSFAMGFGVEARESFYARLQLRLRETGNPQTEVVDAGVMGYLPANSYYYLTEHGWRLEPDAVVLEMWTGNTIWHSASPSCPLPAGSETTMQRARQMVFGLHVAQLLADRLRISDPIRRRMFELGLLARYGVVELLTLGLEQRCSARLLDFQRLLESLKAACEERRVPLLLVIIPMREQVDARVLARWVKYNAAPAAASSLDPDQPTRLIREAAQRAGVRFLDPLPLLRKRSGAASCYFEGYDPHLNATGHLALAEALAPAVATMLSSTQTE